MATIVWCVSGQPSGPSCPKSTSGLLVGVAVHPADIQDRDGARLVIEAVHQLFPWLRHLFADSVYNGPNLREALATFGNWTIEIVKRTADAAGFQLLPRGDGSSNEPSPGSIETAASPKISRLRSRAPKPGSTSPPCRCSLGDWPDNNTIYTIKIRTLRPPPAVVSSTSVPTSTIWSGTTRTTIRLRTTTISSSRPRPGVGRHRKTGATADSPPLVSKPA